jgi:hypothetical protein
MRSLTLMLTAAFCGVASTAVPQDTHAQIALDSRLSLHGYLTQGFGRASDSPFLGLTDTTTSDYRSAAMQMSFDVSPKDRLVIQVSHRRLGSSPLAGFEENIEVDWAFYQRTLGSFEVRAGRFPLAGGIYNEVRDVGTVLPMFRAPYQIYPDGFESVDGLSATHNLALGDWSLESSAFWGGTEYKNVFQTPAGPFPVMYRFANSVGGQVWLGTPIQGLRVGVSALRWSDSTSNRTLMASVDADFDRFLVRAEHKIAKLADTYYAQFSYLQGGMKLIEKLQLVGQYERATIETRGALPVAQATAARDAALGLNYKLSPNLVFKLEQHFVKGYWFDRFVNPTGPAAKSRYGIASVSVSF